MKVRITNKDGTSIIVDGASGSEKSIKAISEFVEHNGKEKVVSVMRGQCFKNQLF